MPQIIDRKTARERGRKYFFTGKPCQNGGIARRYVATGNCRCADCKTAKREKQSSYNKANADRINYDNAWRRAQRLNAIPKWFGELDQFVIEQAFTLARERTDATGYEWRVDHMVPLQARDVCGLHVWNNVQVIPQSLNLWKKNNLVLIHPNEWLRAC